MINTRKRIRETVVFFSKLTLLLAFTQHHALGSEQQIKPNFVWIVSEDNSIHHTKLFFKDGVKTPNIESLANNGVVFQNAFSNSPVCSVARTTLQTGVYANKIGAQYHRPLKPVVRPHGMKFVHEILQDAGYYTTNRKKTDYNLKVDDVATWDDSSKKASWKNRDSKSQPFFHMETIYTSHESSLHFNQDTYQKRKNDFNTKTTKIADYLPDSELNQFTQAYYFKKIKQVDKRVGEIVAQLKDKNLLDNTFVFYFADHGGVLPRSKGYLYDTGLHVPLVVHIPKNFEDKVHPSMVNKSIEGSIEFVDLAPTLLSLADEDIPEYIDGTPLLSKNIDAKTLNSQKDSLGYADRFDEKYDFQRSLRVGNFHYIRNYTPHLPEGLYNEYRYRMLSYQEWHNEHNNNESFFQPKPVEYLFDTNNDPYEQINLADNSKYQQTLVELRSRLTEKLKSIPDLGFYPESYFYEKRIKDNLLFGKENKKNIHRLIDIANLQTAPYSQAKKELVSILKNGDELEKSWAITVAMSFDEKAKDLTPLIKNDLNSHDLHLRFKVISFLGYHNELNPYPHFIDVINKSKNSALILEVFNEMAFFKEFHKNQYPFDPGILPRQHENKVVQLRLSYLKN